jgi:5'(3')-deoxyribonucleotidase
MDGVVADFNEYAYRTLGFPPSAGIYPEDKWHQLAQNPRIYRDLITTTYAQELYNECVNFSDKKNYRLAFLTAVPKGNDIQYAFFDKVEWAQKYFPGVPVFFGPYSKDKYQHCKVGDILIDDRISNIEEWRAAGGLAIHHVDINCTLIELSKLY